MASARQWCLWRKLSPVEKCQIQQKNHTILVIRNWAKNLVCGEKWQNEACGNFSSSSTYFFGDTHFQYHLSRYRYHGCSPQVASGLQSVCEGHQRHRWVAINFKIYLSLFYHVKNIFSDMKSMSFHNSLSRDGGTGLTFSHHSISLWGNLFPEAPPPSIIGRWNSLLYFQGEFFPDSAFDKFL